MSKVPIKVSESSEEEGTNQAKTSEATLGQNLQESFAVIKEARWGMSKSEFPSLAEQIEFRDGTLSWEMALKVEDARGLFRERQEWGTQREK